MPAIPDYPPATVPLDGTEQLAAWQSGQQVYVPVDAIVDKSLSSAADALSLVENAASAVAAAKASALSDISTANSGSLTAIATNRSGALTAIDAERDAAVATITGLATLPPAIVYGTGRRNLFRDPFQRSARLPASQVAMLSMDTTYYPASEGWVAAPAGPNNPYADTYEIRGLAGGYKLLNISLARLGLVPGDAFALAFEIATTGNVSILAQYRGAGGAYIGTTTNWASAVPGAISGKAFKSGDLTVPAGALGIDLSIYSSAAFQIISRWGHLGTSDALPNNPVDELAPPRGYDRLLAAEAQLPANNGLTLKTVSYSARAVVVAGSPSAPAFNPYNGFGVILDTASIPSGFNALEIPGGLVWEPGYNPPTTIFAILRAGVGSEVPFTGGRLIGIGSITVDPTSGSMPTRAILFRDPITGDPVNTATIRSDSGDHLGIGIYGINADGSPCERLYGNKGTTAYASSGSTYGGYWRTTGFGDVEAWSQTYGDGSMALSLVNLTNPKEVYATPSDSFSALIAARVDEAPKLSSCPTTIYCVVGRETIIYWDTLLQRDWRRTNFNATYSAALPPNSGPIAEGWRITPTAPGTTTLTITASRGDIQSDTKVITIITCAASAGAGTKRELMMGDSLVEGNAGQTTLTALSAADGVTTVINVGTKGSGVNKAEGYSGQPLTAFLSPTLISGSGTIANPFINPATGLFDFGYYVTNSLAGVAPTHVLLEGGFWEISHAAFDSQADTGAATWAATAETIIAAIHAYDATIKVAVWTQPLQATDGQDGQNPSSIGSSAGQLRRNCRTLAAKAIDQFSNRTGDKIYVVPAGTCMDPETAYPRAAYAPKNAAVAARYNGTPYATYAAMAADLSPTNETLTYCTEIGHWFIKEGPGQIEAGGAPSGKGRWRNVDERDGFVRRITDGIHVSTGWYQLGSQIFAWIKNVP